MICEIHDCQIRTMIGSRYCESHMFKVDIRSKCAAARCNNSNSTTDNTNYYRGLWFCDRHQQIYRRWHILTLPLCLILLKNIMQHTE